MRRLVVAAAVVVALLGAAGAYRWYASPRDHDVPIDAVSADGRVLTVTVRDAAPPCADGLTVSVAETADEVRLSAQLVRDPGATCPAVLQAHAATIELDTPLGDRRVVDDHGDRRIDVRHRP